MRFLFDASRYSTLLSFKIASCYGDLVPIKITGIDKENDSGECWLFKGCYAFADRLVSGSFCTRDRKGWIEVQD